MLSTVPTMAERMYLTMAAKALGIEKEKPDELMLTAEGD